MSAPSRSVVASWLLKLWKWSWPADHATLLRDRVVLTCRSVDRIFLQGYVPKLQSVGLVCRFLRWQRGFLVPSLAAFGKIGVAYVAKVHKFAADHDIPVVYFDTEKKKRKEKMIKELQAAPTSRRRPGGPAGWRCWVSLRRGHRSGDHGGPRARSTLASNRVAALQCAASTGYALSRAGGQQARIAWCYVLQAGRSQRLRVPSGSSPESPGADPGSSLRGRG